MKNNTDKPHLCFILPDTNTTNVGGMEVVAKDLFNCLDADKYFFTLICFSANNGIIPRIDRTRVNIQVIPKRPGIDKTLIPRLAAYFYSTRPTILHTFNVGGLIYTMPAAALARVPIIVHAEHGRHEVPESFLSRKVRIAMMKRVDHITAVSDDLLQILRDNEGIPEHKISVIINGVDTTPFDASTFDVAAYRQHLGVNLSAEDFVVGTVGALSPRKNQQLLIRAASKIPNIRVLIAGTGPLRDELKHLISELGLENKVFLLGERSDIPQFVQSLDLFVLPSRMEGTSLAILEAMAARKPVVATDVGGTRELVTHSETGFLVKSDDLDDLTRRLEWASKNGTGLIEMGRLGRARIDTQFSFNRTAHAYDTVFQHALKKKGLI